MIDDDLRYVFEDCHSQLDECQGIDLLDGQSGTVCLYEMPYNVDPLPFVPGGIITPITGKDQDDRSRQPERTRADDTPCDGVRTPVCSILKAP